jgi:superfamily II DNA or RNA helicase
MLFYTQIKREFTQASWKRGQNYFREKRVKDVKLDGDVVNGNVRGSGKEAYQTSITMARGTIAGSKCSCPAHREYETHCKHVAALAIWVVERGSLLRSGIISPEHGTSDSDEIVLRSPQKAAGDKRLRKLLQTYPWLALMPFSLRRDLMAGAISARDREGRPVHIPVTLAEATALLEYARIQDDDTPAKARAIQGEAILYVRGIFQRGGLAALVVESGIRYNDPSTKKIQINTLTYLTKAPEPGIWRTSQGLLLRTPRPRNEFEDNFIARLEQQQIIYQGQAALENLAKFLTHRLRSQIVFDQNLNIEVAPETLKLTSMSIGAKTDEGRKLSFLFEGAEEKFTSEELAELAKENRLSSQFVWKGNKLYQFETSLSQLQQYANRAGVGGPEVQGATPGGPPGDESSLKPAPTPVNGFTSLQDDAQNPLHPLAAYRLSLELGVKNFEVDEAWEEFHEWKKTFEKKRIAPLPDMDYGFELRDYQKNGLSWLWSLYHRGLSALLADDMGLGKTHQVLALLTTLYTAKRNKPKQPSLVVAPTSVIAAWIQKLNRYETGLKWAVFHGAGRKLPDSGYDVILTTYGILHREAVLRERDWHIVMLDEAQAIKNATTISSRASRALKAKFRIAMTGTPVENQSTDLWSIMEFILPGYLGSMPRFKRLYGWGREAPSEFQSLALKRLISPFLLRRSKAQVLTELPEKTEEVVLCEMAPFQRRAYRAFLSSADAMKARKDLEGGGKIDYANILAVLTRLKQICDHPRLAEITAGSVQNLGALVPADSGKWDSFEEILNEALGSNLKVVVFTQYLGMIDLISHFLKTREVGHTELRGDTPDRGARLEKFASDPECKVFICSLLAGGLGIDLTAGSVCIHFDRWWNPAKENQATDRLHRFGQTRGVQVFKLQIPGTVEDRIASIIQSKLDLSGALIEESSAGLKSFSRQDLLQLLSPEESDPETLEERSSGVAYS